ncbi:hypothetical protein J437_LFUL007506 [Ladona fulva]|uniref:Uncharacterized protein n=1 Tax=Ladona fulva TaxID=123851 RepID=A0A8K0P560_LADFU|nr:hypothetical protein J437_LFUL007506 [Ladona fulva]
MEEPLRGIRFRTVPEIRQAVDRSIRTINRTGCANGMLRLPHRWKRVLHNAGIDSVMTKVHPSIAYNNVRGWGFKLKGRMAAVDHAEESSSFWILAKGNNYDET